MMESTVNTGMCRCCASEGAFKDIQSTYHWMGEEEVYSDMLRECFDIILNVSEHGEDGGICEVCITQLRNAINFKKQVLHTEEQFKKHLQNKTLFRPNIVKVEMQGDEDSDDNMGSGDDGFSGAEFEVPIKTEEDDPKPKKRAAKASATTTRASAKKAKTDNGESSSKRTRRTTIRGLKIKQEVKPEPKKEQKGEKKRITEKEKENKEALKKLHTNIEEILTCSNATAISGFDYRGYLCCYCDSQYPDPANLKKHNLYNHKGSPDSILPKYNKNRIDEYYVRLDITDLQCKLCNTAIDTIEHLLEHLKSNHKRVIHTDIINQIFPFKFNREAMTCCICSRVFVEFIRLSQHMNTHYRNFICDECGTGFVIKDGLRRHISLHNKGVFKCPKCTKTFDSQIKANNHERLVHIVKHKRSKCGYCNEKFLNHMMRDNHMAKVHGVKLKIVKCHACDKTLPNTSELRIHIRRDHLMERRFKCTECDKAFFQAANLKIHMVKHTGARDFKCTVCNKLYSRKETLRQHMEIHSDVRRFKCEHCKRGFVQKASWKGHMKSKHGEEV